MTDWNGVSRSARRMVGTPCFVFSERHARLALTTLRGFRSSLPLVHWLSLKTQSIGRLLEAALGWGLGIEVVSPFELLAAVGSDVPPSRVLVNGVGKQQWLSRYAVPNLTVHFDSLAEVRALAEAARDLHWRVGFRCAIPPDIFANAGTELVEWNQFGMSVAELRVAAQILRDAKVKVSGLHFHLHTNVERACKYRRALEFVATASQIARVDPEYVDIGGGLPIAGERPMTGPNAACTFNLEEFGHVLRAIPSKFPTAREVWLENGRFLTGAAGALIVTVLDRKERGERTYLICDGGRTNHARLAASEIHDIIVEPNRPGPQRETVVCGPTCGAIDRLGTWMLPESIVPGDTIIWLNAGAYHIPLETRFSFGLVPVVWFNENDEAEVVRERETPEQWWAQWVRSWRTADALSR